MRHWTPPNPRRELEEQYALLRSCFLSEQMTLAEWEGHKSHDPGLVEWLASEEARCAS